MMETKKFLRKEKSAQAMVEFALALPILLLLLYGILEAGRLLFVYSTVVTASRQAARYGSATGENDSGIPLYQDCAGIREAANKVGYLGEFDDIDLAYDQGVTGANPPVSINYTPYCSGATDSSLTTTTLQGNRTRLVVTVTEKFRPIVNLVPFFERDIVAQSARTILFSVPIVVEQEEQEWFKIPTETIITTDNPDPSEIFQYVTVTVTVNNIGAGTPEPTGNVLITGADENCTITLSGGTGSCQVRFDTASQPGNPKIITAFYEGDDEHLASSDIEEHTVTLINTTIEFISDDPDPSVEDQAFAVAVRVTGSQTPTGTVDIDGGGNVRCTITLSNGVGSCTLVYGTAGQKQLSATYSGSGSHLPSGPVTETHLVVVASPTPTRTPTSTPIPTATTIPTRTLTPTQTLTPTPIPSPVASCNQVALTGMRTNGNILSITINNPYNFNLVLKDITVSWNADKGHQTGTDKTLRLQRVDVGSTNVWNGDSGTRETMTIPTTAIMTPGTNVISFYFHQSYDNLDGSEDFLINLLTPGCENDPIE